MISVIVPTYNKSDYLRLTLASFRAQTNKNFELVIADDGSTDLTEQIVKRFTNELPITYIKRENSGRSAARNSAIDAAAGSLLVFSDDDRIVRPDFIAEHARLSKEYGGSRVIIGGKGRILTHWLKDRLPLGKEDLRKLRERFGDEWTSIAARSECALLTEDEATEQQSAAFQRLLLGEEFSGDHSLAVSFERLGIYRFAWVFGTTANMSVPKQAVLDAGKFDTGFQGWGMEDSDLCYRLAKLGLDIREEVSPYNYHQIHYVGKQGRNRQLSVERNKDLWRNIDYFMDKSRDVDSFIFCHGISWNVPYLRLHELAELFEREQVKRPLPYEQWKSHFWKVMLKWRLQWLLGKIRGA